MPVIHLVRAIAFLMTLTLIAMMAHAAVPGEARARAVIAALSTGNAATYEKAAQENFAPAALARRTPAERAEVVARIYGDAGALEIATIDANNEGLTVGVRGAKGPHLTFTFTFDGTPDAKIASMGIRLGEPEEGSLVPPPPVTATTPPAEFASKLDAWIAPHVKSDAFAGVVLVARGGTPIFVRAYGPADRERKIAANTDTAYNIASIGKKFTQVAVAKLIQDGKLKRTTTIGEVIPDYPNAVTRAATVNQLIEMQGGVADFFGAPFEKADKTKFASNHAYYLHVANQPPRFAPGAQREYCNGCYIVLGEMVERLSGKKFEDAVVAAVIGPAGLTRTGYFNTASLPANVAVPYGRLKGPQAPYESTRAMHGAAGSGAGGLYSTAKDLLAFDTALRAGRLLNPEMTAWVLGGGQLGVAGGAPGTNAILSSDGTWTVVVTANVSPPLPESLGQSLARALIR